MLRVMGTSLKWSKYWGVASKEGFMCGETPKELGKIG
jgi:hypothetical protein